MFFSGEIFPTQIRTTSHGLAATMGKLGAIVASIWIINTPNDRDVFLISSMWAVGGVAVTFIFLPDTTGLDLKSLDEFHRHLLMGKLEEYHGEAINPKHLSVFEHLMGWGKYYDASKKSNNHLIAADANKVFNNNNKDVTSGITLMPVHLSAEANEHKEREFDSNLDDNA